MLSSPQKMLRKPISVLLVLLMLLTLLAACSRGGDDPAQPTDAEANQNAPAAEAPADAPADAPAEADNADSPADAAAAEGGDVAAAEAPAAEAADPGAAQAEAPADAGAADAGAADAGAAGAGDAFAVQIGTVVRVQPASVSLNPNESTTLEIRIENVAELFAADIEIRFDPAILQVQDADPGKDGIQVQPGNFPSPDFVAENVADNSAGVIRYALTQLPPSTPLNGSGLMLSITFQGVANGSSNITIANLALATNQGQQIQATPENGTVTVGSGGPVATATPAPVQPTATPQPGATATPTPQAGVTPTATPPAGGVTPTPPPTSGEVIRYVVQPGDTLFSLSRRYGVSVWDIATYNNIYNVNLIYVGQVILIPSAGSTPGQPGDPTGATAYVIKAGDTLYSIARRNGLTVERLAAFNNIVNPNLIYAGQTIHIPAQ